jgi:hypothetical protein
MGLALLFGFFALINVVLTEIGGGGSRRPRWKEPAAAREARLKQRAFLETMAKAGPPPAGHFLHLTGKL